MTLSRGFLQASFFGLGTGTLLALVSYSWFSAQKPSLLPLLLAFWWLVIFGSNLWHTYQLSNKYLPNGPRFALQVWHAGMAALVYYGLDVMLGRTPTLPEGAGNYARLQASLPTEVDVLLSNPNVVVPAAFVLSLATSGLLFSILSKPSAK